MLPVDAASTLSIVIVTFTLNNLDVLFRDHIYQPVVLIDPSAPDIHFAMF